MKICQLMASEEEGGLENHFVELCNGLVSKHDEVTAIAPLKYGDRLDSRVRFHPLKFTLGRRDPLALLKMIRIIRPLSPDIVHAQANKSAEMLASIHRWVPGHRIATVHNVKKQFPGHPAIQTLIGVSQGVIKPLNHPHSHVVYNGLIPYTGPVYTRDQVMEIWGLDDKKPIAIAVGRLVPTKSFDFLIETWRAEFGSLIIFGEGPEEERLRSLIRTKQFEKTVFLGGFRKDIRGVLNAVDLVVFASKREGFSYVLAEALFAGVPVVSTRIAGSEEVLPDECMAPYGDSEKLGAIISTCLKQRQRTRALMRPIFEWARSHLTVENMVDQTRSIYQSIDQSQNPK